MSATDKVRIAQLLGSIAGAFQALAAVSEIAAQIIYNNNPQKECSKVSRKKKTK